MLKNVLARETGGQRDPDLTDRDADLCADFEQVQPNGMRLGASQFCALKPEPPQTVHQNIGEG